MAQSVVFNPFTGNFDAISTVSLGAVGSSPNADGASITSISQVLTLQPADGTNPGVLTAIAQTLGGSKTFLAQIQADGGLDVTATAGTDTLNIGVNNADVINIGNTGAAINLYGTTFYQDVTNLQVTDKLITVNKGGAVASGFNAGLEIEENAVITAYVDTSADRNSWELKAPNTAGIATITPGASGITIDQSSHDPVTLTAVGAVPNADGASLSGQALTLQPADGTNPGLITAAAQTIGGDKTFSGAISASNFSGSSSGSNTGDVTLAAVGSAPNANAATLTGQILNLEPADATSPGVITAGTQTIGGDKTFNGALVAGNGATVNSAVLTANAGLTVVGTTTLSTSLTGPLKTASGVVSAAAIDLASSEVTGTLPETKGGTGESTYATGDILYSDTTNSLAKLAIGANTYVLTSNGTVPSWQPSGSAPTYTAPKVTTYTSGSGTHTNTGSPLYIRVQMVGGGAGGGAGGGSGGSPGSGTAGGSSTFGTSLLTAGGGAGGSPGIGAGGAGGTNTVNSPAVTIINVEGGRGAPGGIGLTNGYAMGGNGGATFFGGAGPGGGYTLNGSDGATNSGAGGGGGNSGAGSGAGTTSGGGGGAGGYIEALITSPSASYSYAVGSAGNAGTPAGTGATGGGNGGTGVIIVTEYYQ